MSASSCCSVGEVQVAAAHEHVGDEAEKAEATKALTELPPELLEGIFVHLKLCDLHTCTQCCNVLTANAQRVLDATVRKLKDQLAFTLNPALECQPYQPATHHSPPLETVSADACLKGGKAILSTACKHGSLGHLCGYLRVNFKDTDFPCAGDFKCYPTIRVLHAGARLRVKLSDATRAALGDQVPAADPVLLPPPKQDYFTCNDIVTARDNLAMSVLAPHVALLEKAARASGTWDTESPPADRAAATLRVESFALEEVVLTMGHNVYNSEYYWDNF